jgi:hypothetical protein
VRRREIAVVVALSLMTFFSCEKDSGRPMPKGWSFIGLEGFEVRGLFMSWPHLYACADTGGVFRADTAEGDGEWDYLGLGGSHFLGGAVLEDGTIFVLTPGRMQWSRDGGATWEPPHGASAAAGKGANYFTCMYAWGSTVLAANTGPGIVRSDDNARTWEADYYFSGVEVGQIECYVPSLSPIWAAAGFPFRLSSSLFVSHGGRGRWVPLDVRSGDSVVSPRSIALDAADSSVVYIGADGAVFKSADSGTTWTAVLEVPWEVAFTEMGWDHVAPGLVFAAAVGERNLLYVSWESGGAFEPLEYPGDAAILDLLVDGERRTLYVGTENGVYSYTY